MANLPQHQNHRFVSKHQNIQIRVCMTCTQQIPALAISFENSSGIEIRLDEDFDIVVETR